MLTLLELIDEESENNVFLTWLISHLYRKLNGFLKHKITVDGQLFIVFIDVRDLSEYTSILLIHQVLKLWVLDGRIRLKHLVILDERGGLVCFETFNH